MVHIKQVELSHFKSFGGTTQVPLLTGFTVISGPNGSGKSNILDALLFCLGLASSRGMRAERLPDLVNHKQSNHRGTSEVSVTVTFDLEGVEEDLRQTLSAIAETNGNGATTPLIPEWRVTRRLRVTQGGNYSSTYYSNGEVCNASELHAQLNRLRIYPEGYNVVLQGDVTRIITMNSRERREIIDELAGVAEFDRKIERVKKTLEEVKEREERCHIIEQELERSLQRLAADRVKAEKYQKLKAKIQEKQQWEVVLIWRSLQQQEAQLQGKIRAGEAEEAQLKEQLEGLGTEIGTQTAQLEELNARVKALGEDEQLSVTSKLATQKVKRTQLQQQQQELEATAQQTREAIAALSRNLEAYRQTGEELEREQAVLAGETIVALTEERDRAKERLEALRQQASEIASASEAWVQEQTALSKQINALQQTLNPQRTERAQLTERNLQLEQKIQSESRALQATEAELQGQQGERDRFNLAARQQQIQDLAQQLASQEEERNLEQATQTRLLQEQRDKQRQLDKLEATETAQQEARGTYATKTILQANLPGVCGLVAQLGQVEPRYQRALETAAGGRLGNIVVEDDGVAAAGIELLKQKRSGRATFLPLNKMRPPRGDRPTVLRYARGFVDYAVELVDCQPRYRTIFAYVFGSTAVFETLEEARSHLGKVRIVTLAGELLESSGAMTGGSQSSRATLHFGTVTARESEELAALRERLTEIELILERCDRNIEQRNRAIAQLSQQLTTARQQQREEQLKLEQLQKEGDRLVQQREQLRGQLERDRGDLEVVSQRLQALAATIPQQEEELRSQQQRLAELETSQTHSEWQAIQQQIKAQEGEVQGRDAELRRSETRLQEVENQRSRLQEKVSEGQQRQGELKEEEGKIGDRRTAFQTQLASLETEIRETEALLTQLSAKLGEAKQERDRAEKTLQDLKERRQQQAWQLQKLQETQQERKTTLIDLQAKLAAQTAELPDPLPEIPNLISSNSEGEAIAFDNYSAQLEQLQKQLHSAQKRLQAMEPVNMLALEEYERTETRLQELSEKVQTLEAERTELLLRIENFTTLRFRAFKEAFDAVNANFQTIFATLSEGDGYLQLENPDDIFAGGLTLIAHPKGKPVQRLSSMSGGEKSLTALSFIFALQRYRPSPFYAFDEVDMFLDGANVERLAKMIKQEAQQAQFIVVSLRRPMIESAERTIGVTQARGAHTQVLGIKL